MEQLLVKKRYSKKLKYTIKLAKKGTKELYHQVRENA